MHYVQMSAIKAQADRMGSHWFSQSTMRFFRSRVAQYGYGTVDPYEQPNEARVFFVSSEQFQGSDGRRAPRAYTVRVMDWATGNVGTVGEFQAYGSRGSADRAARKLASGAATVEV